MRLVLDAGAFIGVERGNAKVLDLIARADRSGIPQITSAIVVAQVWLDGQGRQAALARVLNGVDVYPVDLSAGKAAGQLCKRAGTSDPIDAALVLLARSNDRILTSDPDDIHRLALEARLKVKVISC